MQSPHSHMEHPCVQRQKTWSRHQRSMRGSAKNPDVELCRPGSYSWLCHLLALWLNLGVISKYILIITSTAWVCGRDYYVFTKIHFLFLLGNQLDYISQLPLQPEVAIWLVLPIKYAINCVLHVQPWPIGTSHGILHVLSLPLSDSYMQRVQQKAAGPQPVSLEGRQTVSSPGTSTLFVG